MRFLLFLLILICSVVGQGATPPGRIIQSALITPNVLPVYCTFTGGNGSALTTTDATGTNGSAVMVLNWKGGSGWGVYGNAATNAPTVNSEVLTNPGLETPYSGGLANGWSLLTTPTVTQETTIIHGGTSSQKIVGGSTGYGVYQYQSISLNTWYQESAWIYHATGDAGTFNINLVFDAGGATNYYYTSITANSTWTYFAGTSVATATTGGMSAKQSGATSATGYLDDASVRALTLSSLVMVVSYAKSDVSSEVSATIATGTRTPMGLIICCDSPTNPQNFLLGLHDRQAAALWKCVNGVYSRLLYVNATYGDGYKIRVDKIGTSVNLYYNGALISGSPVTIADATLVKNTYHGVFGTFSGNSVDNFGLYPK